MTSFKVLSNVPESTVVHNGRVVLKYTTELEYKINRHLWNTSKTVLPMFKVPKKEYQKVMRKIINPIRKRYRQPTEPYGLYTMKFERLLPMQWDNHPESRVELTDRLWELLNRLHKKSGWVHRDIKPENIVVVDNKPIFIDVESAINITQQGIKPMLGGSVAEKIEQAFDPFLAVTGKLRFTHRVGTDGFWFPELARRYQKKRKEADVMTVGQLLFVDEYAMAMTICNLVFRNLPEASDQVIFNFCLRKCHKNTKRLDPMDLCDPRMDSKTFKLVIHKAYEVLRKSDRYLKEHRFDSL